MNVFLIFLLVSYLNTSLVFQGFKFDNNPIIIFNEEQLVNDDLNGIKLYIFSSGLACTDCYRKLNKIVAELNSEKELKIDVIALIDSQKDNLSKRQELNRFKSLYDFSDYFFCPSDLKNEIYFLNPFEYFKVFATPSILIMNFKGQIYLDSEKLFIDSKKTKQVISEALKYLE